MAEKKRTKAEYRSSLRSKRLIREALVTMMREKPFEKITITDIVRTADINRGTFYAHFKDTDEVLRSIRELAAAEVREAFSGMTADIVLANPRPLFEALTAILIRDTDYYRLLLSVSEFRRALVDSRVPIVEYLMESTTVQHLATDPATRSWIAGTLDFIVSGVVGICLDVLLEVSDVDLEAIPDLLTKVAGGAVRQISEALR